MGLQLTVGLEDYSIACSYVSGTSWGVPHFPPSKSFKSCGLVCTFVLFSGVVLPFAVFLCSDGNHFMWVHFMWVLCVLWMGREGFLASIVTSLCSLLIGWKQKIAYILPKAVFDEAVYNCLGRIDLKAKVILCLLVYVLYSLFFTVINIRICKETFIKALKKAECSIRLPSSILQSLQSILNMYDYDLHSIWDWPEFTSTSESVTAWQHVSKQSLEVLFHVLLDLFNWHVHLAH